MYKFGFRYDASIYSTKREIFTKFAFIIECLQNKPHEERHQIPQFVIEGPNLQDSKYWCNSSIN